MLSVGMRRVHGVTYVRVSSLLDRDRDRMIDMDLSPQQARSVAESLLSYADQAEKYT